MSDRRILSLWFPHLSAERMLRRAPELTDQPFAVAAEARGLLLAIGLNRAAVEAGLHPGMPLGDARAICPSLITRPFEANAEESFRTALLRWAGQFSPWVAADDAAQGSGALILDLTGAAHLWGGEAGLVETVQNAAARLGLSVRIGLADTRGAAWALARYGSAGPVTARSGDDIDQEAHATRVRAHKRRHWERGGAAPLALADPAALAPRIAPPGQTRRVIGPLPVTALRLPEEAAATLIRLGLRRIDDLAGLPRGAVGRRFGTEVLRRLDQALGSAPEPISPVAEAPLLSVRLTLPEPVGLRSDIEAALTRLSTALAERLAKQNLGARRLRLVLSRVDHQDEVLEVGLARPSRDPHRLPELFAVKLDGVDAGFGIDRIRLTANAVEPLGAQQHVGHLAALAEGEARRSPGGGEAFADLLNRLGARLGLDALTRPLPADSHLPEKSAIVASAAFAEAAPHWPQPPAPRPVRLFEPERIRAEDPARPPARFRWRRQIHATAEATGPERIAPEWWLDDPAWRTGPRDYWRIETEEGRRLWLYETPTPPTWYVHGEMD
ncbi:MAG: DNA polymerase Y family protein [Pseudomonadota bacterium]